MSSKGSAQRLLIDCHHQQILRALFVSCTVAASACLLAVPLSWSLTVILLLLLYLLALRTWRARCELGGENVSLLWDAEGRWWWRQSGEEIELLLAGESYLSTWLIVLNLRHPLTGKGYELILCPAGSRKELFRRLTVRLRLEGRGVTAGQADSFEAKEGT